MTYTYDELDRVDTGIYRNELNAEKLFHDYKYDAEDNLYEVAERVDFTNNRTYTRTFDKRNRLKSSTDAYGKTVAFTYDSANNLKSLTDAGSKVTSYNYDSQNRLDTVAQNSSTIADYDWYSDGLLKQVKYSETSKRDYNYDNADRVSNITNTIGTGSESFDYGYDANSNRENETRNIDGAVSKTIAYNYDQLNRLESASYTANSATNQLSYTYDKVGNRKTETGTDQQGNAVNKTADYDDLDRLTKLTETNLVSDFEYDDNSNLTKVKLNNVDNETFEYDIRNQLTNYTSIGNGIAVNFDYDFERKRLSKEVAGNRRDYVYAGNQVINEYLADNLNASYGIGSGEIVSSDFVNEGTRNYFSDALGSITSLADSSSSLISRNDYDSFGEITSSSGSSQNSITYTGQRLDVESGLMALGNGERYYNPSYGRFIQQDSYAGMPDIPQSLNRFSYAHNNPNKYTDPSGNAVITATLIVAGIILVGTGTYSAKRGNELEAAEQNWAKDDIRTSWGSAFSDGTGMTQAFKGFTGTDPYKGSENAYKDKPSWHRVWDATIGSLEVIGNATGVSGTLAKGVKVFTNTARVGVQLASAFAKSASRVGRQIGAKAVSIAKQTATIGKRGLRTITTGAKKATESVREMAGKLGNVFEDAFSPQMATPNGVPIRASQVDDVASETRMFSKSLDDAPTGGSLQKKVFDPSDVDDFLNKKIAKYHNARDKTFLIGETQPRVDFIAEYANKHLGERFKTASEFWAPNYEFFPYIAEIVEKASITYNKYIIRRLHKSGYKFYDVGIDEIKKGRSKFYKAELDVLNELGVIPIKYKPKFRVPKFKTKNNE